MESIGYLFTTYYSMVQDSSSSPLEEVTNLAIITETADRGFTHYTHILPCGGIFSWYSSLIHLESVRSQHLHLTVYSFGYFQPCRSINESSTVRYVYRKEQELETLERLHQISFSRLLVCRLGLFFGTRVYLFIRDWSLVIRFCMVLSIFFLIGDYLSCK